MTDDYRPTLTHQWFVAIHVEQVAETGALHEHWIHYRIHVVRTDIRYADDQNVRLTLHRNGVLLKYAGQCFLVNRFSLARPHAGHAVRSRVSIEQLPAQTVR